MSPKTKTVLVVDDDEGMRDTLTAILKREYLILTAATGEEGLAILNRKDVDLILLDVRLPGMSGLELLTIVRENYSLVEVIMVSALSEVEVAVTAMKQGAYHYITKEMLNAIEATAPGGLVTLSTEERDSRVRILVRDTGTGIPHDRLENIFEDFKTTKRTGLGLGLAISRKIVNQLGGDISVTSTVGHGTTFSMEFDRVEGRPEVPAATAAAS